MGRRYDEPHGPNLSTAERSRVSLTQERTSLSRVHWLHVLALTCLLAAVGISTFTFKISVLDLDLGWHLKTGDWIIQHFAVPHNGLFTWTAADHPWAAYSWGYEVLLSRANAWFGLTGIALYYYPKSTVALIKQYIAEGNNPDQPGRLVQWLYPRTAVYTWPVPGIWFDIGSKETLEEANKIFAKV